MSQVHQSRSEIAAGRSAYELTKRAVKKILGSYVREEIIYQGIVDSFVRAQRLDVSLYPVKSAANYSFLYLISRIGTQLPIRSVLEFGAGESSILLDALSKRNRFSVVTVEGDPLWRDLVQQRVDHRVIHAPLVDVTFAGFTSAFYARDAIERDQKFDMVIVDGPLGTERRSRWGCNAWLEDCLADEFIVIFDDAERRGEAETILAAFDLLSRKRPDLRASYTDGRKRQWVFATKRFEAALYF